MAYKNTSYRDDDEPYRPVRRRHDDSPLVWLGIIILVVIWLCVIPFLFTYRTYERFTTPPDHKCPEFAMSEEEKKWWISTLIGVLVLVGFVVAVAIYYALRSSGGA